MWIIAVSASVHYPAAVSGSVSAAVSPRTPGPPLTRNLCLQLHVCRMVGEVGQ